MPAVRAGLANLSTVGQSDAHVIGGSLVFDGPSTDYLSRTFGAGNRRTYTISFWAKPSNHDEHGPVGTGGGQVFSAGTVGGGARATFGFSGVTNGANKDAFQLGHNATGSSWASLNSDSKFRDFSAWQHFVVSVDVTQNTASNRVKLYANGVEQPLTGTYPNDEDQPVNNNGIGHAIGRYNPEGTDYFDGYLSNFYFIDGQALSPSEFGFTDPLTNTWRPKKYQGAQAPNAIDKIFSANFAASDGFQATAPAINAFNGGFGTVDQGRAACSSSGCTITLSSIDVEVKSKLEIWSGYGSASVNGGTAVNYDGSAPGWQDLSFTGALSSIAITGASGLNAGELYAVRVDGVILVDGGGYGVNGFDLPFDGSAAIGTDQSGRGNDWTANNITDADVRPDSPSGCSFSSNLSSGISGISTSQAPSGYCTWNPIQPVTNGAGNRTTYTNGNLTGTTNNSWTTGGLGTIGVSSGKWYWEITSGAYTGGTGLEIGAAKDTLQWTISNSEGAGTSAGAYLYYNDGRKGNNNSASSYGSTYTDGDILGVALDLDAGTISFYKNGVSQGIAFTGLSGIFYPCFSDYNDSGTAACTANFGQNAFTFPVPLGHQPLNLANLPSPEFVRSDSVVGVTTYPGNSATQFISPGNFSPDMVWMKGYSETLQWRNVDTIRGQAQLKFNSTDPSATWTSIEWLPGKNGYNITDDGNEQNKTGASYVSYGFKAGGNPGISTSAYWIDDKEYASAAAAGLDGGTITPDSASIGTRQGLSILKYRGNGTSGATISHGLSQAPDFFIIKSTIYSYNWNVYHQAMGNTHLIRLNDTAAQVTESGAAWNDTSPTSSVITFGNLGGTNMDTAEYMAYIWHDVPGLQKFGSYDGNSANDGIFVNCGFEPALIIIKVIDDTNSWYLHDIARTPTNPSNDYLNPNLSAGQTASSHPLDILSNGFKLRNGTYDGYNGNFTYIYAAWAHQPFNNLYGGQSNAV